MQTKRIIRRELTAISRPALSRPIKLALDRGFINTTTSVFDYGCGKGTDVARLNVQGVEAWRWDPYYFPDNPLVAADVVNLGYVANVIEKPRERSGVLKAAWELANELLIVAVRAEGGLKTLSSYEVYSDGVLTCRDTFQKFYSHRQAEQWIKRHLGVRPQESVSGSGEHIFFVHRH